MTEVESLNLWLAEQGRSLEGKVLYRLVWSEKIYENRFGTFCDYTSDGLFIREVKETRLTRKYNYIKDRYILEKFAPGNLTASVETPDAINGDYIPVYVFEDKNGKYLPPTQKVLRFILGHMRGSIPRDEEPPEELMEDPCQFDTHPDFRTSGPTRNAIAYTKGLKNAT